MGLDGYLASRDKVKSQFMTTADKFRQKMLEFSGDDSKNMVFSEDLKNMIHLAEKEDIPLVVKMMKKFTSQNQELKFSSYVFGPVVMRMFYYLKDEETALQCFKDKSLSTLFDQWMTYQLLLDMLYTKERYQDVVDAYEVIKERQVNTMFPKYAMVVLFGALYKLNTKESLDYTMELWKAMAKAGHAPMRRSTTFAVALALAQNAPHIALELIYNEKQQNYITVRNLKVLALLELNRVEDILPILRSVLEADGAITNKQTFCKDVLEKVHAAMESCTNKEMKLDFDRVEKFLIDHGHVTDSTVNELLCSEIVVTNSNNMGQNRNQAFINASFDRSSMNRSKRPQQGRSSRPGLSEMY